MTDIRITSGEKYTSIMIEPTPYFSVTQGNILLVLEPKEWTALKEAVDAEEAIESGDFEVGKEE